MLCIAVLCSVPSVSSWFYNWLQPPFTGQWLSSTVKPPKHSSCMSYFLLKYSKKGNLHNIHCSRQTDDRVCIQTDVYTSPLFQTMKSLTSLPHVVRHYKPRFWNAAECEKHGCSCFDLTKGTTKPCLQKKACLPRYKPVILDALNHHTRHSLKVTLQLRVPSIYLPVTNQPMGSLFFTFIPVLSVIHHILAFIRENQEASTRPNV